MVYITWTKLDLEWTGILGGEGPLDDALDEVVGDPCLETSGERWLPALIGEPIGLINEGVDLVESGDNRQGV